MKLVMSYVTIFFLLKISRLDTSKLDLSIMLLFVKIIFIIVIKKFNYNYKKIKNNYHFI